MLLVMPGKGSCYVIDHIGHHQCKVPQILYQMLWGGVTSHQIKPRAPWEGAGTVVLSVLDFGCVAVWLVPNPLFMWLGISGHVSERMW